MSSSQITAKMIFRKSFSFRGDKTNIQWFPGHMVKGLRQMRKALIETDCVIEVHDARIPLSGQNIFFNKTQFVRCYLYKLQKVRCEGLQSLWSLVHSN